MLVDSNLSSGEENCPSEQTVCRHKQPYASSCSAVLLCRGKYISESRTSVSKPLEFLQFENNAVLILDYLQAKEEFVMCIYCQ
jgi:hypothetical protein